MGKPSQIAHDLGQGNADDVLVERSKRKRKHQTGEHGLYFTGSYGRRFRDV